VEVRGQADPDDEPRGWLVIFVIPKRKMTKILPAIFTTDCADFD
jgi:hypothetical protein